MGCVKTRTEAPEIISVASARILGLKRYYTGKPCKNGHVAERLVSNGTCLDCQLETFSRAKVRDPARFSKYSEETQARFKIKHPNANKAYYTKHKHKHVVRNKEWRMKNPERAGAIRAAYKKRNPHKNCEYSNRRRAAKLNATPKWLTREHIAEMEGIYAAARAMGKGYHVDHTIPLINPIVCGLHVPWNLQIIPAKDNYSKNNRFVP